MEDGSSFEDTMNFGTDDVIVATYNKCGKFEKIRRDFGGFCCHNAQGHVRTGNAKPEVVGRGIGRTIHKYLSALWKLKNTTNWS